MENYADLMFTEAVADLQRAEGTYEKFQTFYPHRTQETLSENDVNFIRTRESFYIATVNADGWPYIQHRGGPRGFIKVLDNNRLACADYHGNQQYITMGNLKSEARASLFFMDYMNHARLKVQGKATLIDLAEADQDLVSKLDFGDLPAERALVIDIVAMDWNCPKYIPTLYPEDALKQIISPQIGALRAENEQLKAEVAALKKKPIS